MKTIGVLIFPGFELLDLFGPLQMFGMLKDDFDIQLVAERAGPVASNQSVCANADVTFDQTCEFDLILVPGGAGTRQEIANPLLLRWIAEASKNTELTLSVCTGSALLARAGVLDGLKATTNKMSFQWVADQANNVEWVEQARWVEDGKFFTSSGVSAGMDMTLAVIARLKGSELAHKVATWCEYQWNSDRDVDPFAKIHGLGG